MDKDNIIWKEMVNELDEGKVTTLWAWPNPNNPLEFYYETYGIKGITKETAKEKILKQIEQKSKSKK